MAGSVASKAARDALFLDRFSATDLPYVDIAVAALVGVIAGVYIRVGARTNLRNIQIASLLVFASIAFGFWAASGPSMPGTASPASAGALFVAIYIWVGALSVLAADAGLDAGQLRPDDARGQACVRLDRRRRHSRLDCRRPRHAADRRHASAPRARCCGWPRRSSPRRCWSGRSGGRGRSARMKPTSPSTKATTKAVSGQLRAGPPTRAT